MLFNQIVSGHNDAVLEFLENHKTSSFRSFSFNNSVKPIPIFDMVWNIMSSWPNFKAQFASSIIYLYYVNIVQYFVTVLHYMKIILCIFIYFLIYMYCKS
ncbi:hypothetical protein WN943_018969 [Citrus x changshan-huyou]